MTERQTRDKDDMRVCHAVSLSDGIKNHYIFLTFFENMDFKSLISKTLIFLTK
jgi:hypothetical protein